MRLVKFEVSEQLLRDALHVPTSATFVGYETHLVSAGLNLVITAEIPGSVGKGESPFPMTVTPVIHHEPEKFTWDWNLPKEKDERSELSEV